jgi:hypothetical protein
MIGLGLLLPAEPDYGHAVRGRIGLAVASPVQAVPIRLPRAGC